jgi:hypothetical protein
LPKAAVAGIRFGAIGPFSYLEKLPTLFRIKFLTILL